MSFLFQHEWLHRKALHQKVTAPVMKSGVAKETSVLDL